MQKRILRKWKILKLKCVNVNLKTSATALKVAVDLFRPPTTDIKLMYKIQDTFLCEICSYDLGIVKNENQIIPM